MKKIKNLYLTRITTELHATHFFWGWGGESGESILYTLSNGSRRFDPETRAKGREFQQRLLELKDDADGLNSGTTSYDRVRYQLMSEERYHKKLVALEKEKLKAQHPSKRRKSKIEVRFF